MKISYNWLKKNLGELPGPEELAQKITFGVFEIESVEEVGNDTVFDLKVLPDRAHYALSWNGIAYEVAAILGIPQQKKKYEKVAGSGEALKISVEDQTLCGRYMGRVVRGVSVTDSPQWVKDELEKIGQRSINSLVDMSNLVMFETGQPMHVFDADKMKGGIFVRRAKSEETITTLDNKSLDLNESMLVIADSEKALGIAGVKGGRAAEVTKETKNIIIESANFNSVSIRKTSTKIKIKTDASKRFENELSPETCAYAMDMISGLIKRENPQAAFGDITDFYPNPAHSWTVEFRRSYIESRLGRKVSDKDITRILGLLQCSVTQDRFASARDDNYIVQPPFFRLDLKIEEDFVEEVGRLLGYDKVEEALPPKISENPIVDREFFASERVKDILVREGFSEVILYTLGERGELETLYPVAEDKGILRSTLQSNLQEALELNMRNADLLELSVVKLFEVGKVFDKRGERLALGMAVGLARKAKGIRPKDVLSQSVEVLEEALGFVPQGFYREAGDMAFWEADLHEIVGKLDISEPYKKVDFGIRPSGKFKPFSKFPFAVRDVAVFVPSDIKEEEVRAVVEKGAGELCVKLRLFDKFVKGEKTSYAYRFVFQAADRTLTEEEINKPLNAVYDALKFRGWEVR